MISIWQKNFKSANEFVRDNGLENFFVQFIKDDDMRSAYWIVFKDMPNSVFLDLQLKYNKPSLTYL